MDECTADQQFVFEIRDNPPSISVDPTKLVIPGYPDCKPVFVNNKVAIFKFGFKECGVRVYNISGTVIYMAEVLMAVDVLHLKYGAITRTEPLRFMVECRYSASSGTQKSLISVGVMVKTPSSSLPSTFTSSGLYSVHLRIARDSNYSSYYPSFSLPLQVLLGTPLYLEVLLHCSRPEAVLLVNYCIAYPRSAKNALVLVYEGCANPFDSMTILRVNDTNQNRQQRRFEVRAFQFMDITSQKHLDEEKFASQEKRLVRSAALMEESRLYMARATARASRAALATARASRAALATARASRAARATARTATRATARTATRATDRATARTATRATDRATARTATRATDRTATPRATRDPRAARDPAPRF
ncbi:zona pellucida sperm-binding protein 4-like [Nelusetta ayraudi]|uniref:zona pellucida sperm-binding protein 4-like n=1 Tax=Nelusetta ayraudi TaxID=303726 RepID=UPI003F72D136